MKSTLLLLGASNARKGLHHLMSAARRRWGPELDVYGAIGHGSSLRLRTEVCGRGLCSMLDSSMWAALPEGRRVHAVLADVGNDIVYGMDTATVLRWVREAMDRLVALRARAVVVGLPVPALDQMPTRLLSLFARLLFPQQRTDVTVARLRATEVDRGLRELAEERGFSFVPARLEWFGLDPIHPRRRQRRSVWEQVLENLAPVVSPEAEEVHWTDVWLARPEHWSYLLEDRHTPQPCRELGATRLFLY